MSSTGPRASYAKRTDSLYSRDERRAGMDKAIVDTIIELARTGKIGVLESQEGCA